MTVIAKLMGVGQNTGVPLTALVTIEIVGDCAHITLENTSTTGEINQLFFNLDGRNPVASNLVASNFVRTPPFTEPDPNWLFQDSAGGNHQSGGCGNYQYLASVTPPNTNLKRIGPGQKLEFDLCPTDAVPLTEANFLNAPTSSQGSMGPFQIAVHFQAIQPSNLSDCIGGNFVVPTRGVII